MKFHFIQDDKLLEEMKHDMEGGKMLTGEYKQKWIPHALLWLSAHQEKKKEMLARAKKLLEKAQD
jgi:tryptophanyl-tRNA synthetase